MLQRRKGVPIRIRLENCFNGRTIKTNRRIENIHDEKANVKFGSEETSRQRGESHNESPKFLQEAKRVDFILCQHVNFIVFEGRGEGKE